MNDAVNADVVCVASWNADLISRVIDQIILPAATCGSANPSLPDHTRNPIEKEDS